MQRSSPSTLLQINNEHFLSTYRGELTTRNIIECVKKIKQAFPSLPPGFYDVLSERITHHKFSDERLRDAVNNAIDNCVYPTPTIAQFVSFDRRIKVLTYDEYIKKIEDNGEWIGKDYKPIRFADQERPVWIHVNDIKKYNLQNENN